MNVEYIRKLIKLVEESEIGSLEIKSWGRTIRINHSSGTASNGHGDGVPVIAPTVAAPAPVAPAPLAAVPAPAAEAPAEDKSDGLVEVKAPMVGTFYSAAAPDASAYVSLNEKISVGQVVCIVEAMKLMNEIESEVSGRVAKIMVENAQPVQYGQTLFLIDPK
jgi:acetyl-CoA carboxylase biotin carboxyl carrier protein